MAASPARFEFAHLRPLARSPARPRSPRRRGGAGSPPWALLALAGAAGLTLLVLFAPVKPLVIASAPVVAETPAGIGRHVLPGRYEAQALRVVDGDTFLARVPVWFGQDVETLVRLRGVDAPELKARCAAEADGAARARAALADLLASGRVSLSQVGGDKYFGRVVATVTVSDPGEAFPPTDVGAALVAAGLARPYDGRARGSWCAGG